MKLNNKGVTLVEIIISVALISIVVVFLFALLIQVNNENSENEVRSSYLINQATFIKQIEEDFIDYKYDGNEQSCSIDESLNISNLDNNNYICIKFNYNEGYYGYLFKYKTIDNKYLLAYYRGENSEEPNYNQTVELEDYTWDGSEIDFNNQNNFIAIKLPIIGPDGNDYSINLSYYYE